MTAHLILVTLVAATVILPPDQTVNLYVGNFNGDNVLVYDTDGVFLRSFTANGLDEPRGIAFGPNDVIYVASQSGDAIHMFDRQEQHLGTFNAPGELDSPTGMALSPTDELYVGSFDNDRVVVFDLEGRFLRSFSGTGLNGPNCVMFDDDGNIYVSSALSNEVLKFDATENYLFSFTSDGLASPMSIARRPGDTERVYVSSGANDRIYVFDTSGSAMDPPFISHPDLNGAQGVALDQDGHLWSCSFFDDAVVHFDDNDDYIATITAGGLRTPRSMAFAPSAAGPPSPAAPACGSGALLACVLCAAGLLCCRPRFPA